MSGGSDLHLASASPSVSTASAQPSPRRVTSHTLPARATIAPGSGLPCTVPMVLPPARISVSSLTSNTAEKSLPKATGSAFGPIRSVRSSVWMSVRLFIMCLSRSL